MYLSRQGSSIAIQTPAKLNLFLEVRARRPDGFHELETLITAISLFDTLQLTEQPSRLTLATTWASGVEAARQSAQRNSPPRAAQAGQGRAGGADISRDLGSFSSMSRVGSLGKVFDDLPDVRDNLVWRAACRMLQEAGKGRGAHLQLTKRIPAAAGLGGASSDAAATLVGLNQLWGLKLSARKLGELAAELGSDVPFFLSGGAAVCRGRGERIEPVAGGGRLHVVLVKPPAGLATADVYRRCRPAEPPWSVQGLQQAFERGDARAVALQLRNRLQEPARQLSPWIECLERQFRQLDCLGHQMSGSGTTYFGLMRNARTARRATGILRAVGWDGAFAAASIRTPSRFGVTAEAP